MTYRVCRGDTVSYIAKGLRLTRSELGALNDLSKPFKAGQVLKLAVRANHPASLKKWSHFLHAERHRFENSVHVCPLPWARSSTW